MGMSRGAWMEDMFVALRASSWKHTARVSRALQVKGLRAHCENTDPEESVQLENLHGDEGGEQVLSLENRHRRVEAAASLFDKYIVRVVQQTS